MLIFETKTIKEIHSKDYNYKFNKITGFFARWGKKKEDDPLFSPFGPEILDIEVTTKCDGVGGKLCPFCYKSNTPNGKNMSFETFKKMIDKFPTYKQNKVVARDKNGKDHICFMPANWEIEGIKREMTKAEVVSQELTEVPLLTQIAFGADSKAESNPDLWKMMDYCREMDVVPNITVAQISDEVADKLVEKCGAVAVSRYDNKDICYDSVKKLNNAILRQKILVRKSKRN